MLDPSMFYPAEDGYRVGDILRGMFPADDGRGLATAGTGTPSVAIDAK